MPMSPDREISGALKPRPTDQIHWPPRRNGQARESVDPQVQNQNSIGPEWWLQPNLWGRIRVAPKSTVPKHDLEVPGR